MFWDKHYLAKAVYEMKEYDGAVPYYWNMSAPPFGVEQRIMREIAQMETIDLFEIAFIQLGATLVFTNFPAENTPDWDPDAAGFRLGLPPGASDNTVRRYLGELPALIVFELLEELWSMAPSWKPVFPRHECSALSTQAVRDIGAGPLASRGRILWVSDFSLSADLPEVTFELKEGGGVKAYTWTLRAPAPDVELRVMRKIAQMETHNLKEIALAQLVITFVKSDFPARDAPSRNPGADNFECALPPGASGNDVRRYLESLPALIVFELLYRLWEIVPGWKPAYPKR